MYIQSCPNTEGKVTAAAKETTHAQHRTHASQVTLTEAHPLGGLLLELFKRVLKFDACLSLRHQLRLQSF